MSKLWNFTLNHSTVLLLLLLILASIFLRFYSLPEKPFWEDEALYAEISQEILQGDLGANNIPIYPPSFFYLNAIGQFLFGNTEFGNRFFTALLGSFSVFLIFLIGKKLFHKTVGLFAASLLAFSPEHIIFSREALPFVVGMFFFLLAFYTLLAWIQSPKEKQRTLFLLSLITVFLSFIFHFVISAFFIVLIPFLIKLYKRRFSFASVILIATALMVFLYFFANLISSFFLCKFPCILLFWGRDRGG